MKFKVGDLVSYHGVEATVSEVAEGVGYFIDRGEGQFVYESDLTLIRECIPANEGQQAMARLREGTEVLRTGGGAHLTAGECNALLDSLARVTQENEDLKQQLEVTERANAGLLKDVDEASAWLTEARALVAANRHLRKLDEDRIAVLETALREIVGGPVRTTPYKAIARVALTSVDDGNTK